MKLLTGLLPSSKGRISVISSRPKVNDEDKLVFRPELSPFWERFLEIRKGLEPYRADFEKSYDASGTAGHEYFHKVLKGQLQGKNFRLEHRYSRFGDGLFHKRSCPRLDTRNNANGWEYSFHGRVDRFAKHMSQYLLASSPLLLTFIEEYQGLWLVALEAWKDPRLTEVAPSSSEMPANLSPYDADIFRASSFLKYEHLAPGFHEEIGWALRKFKIRIMRQRESDVFFHGRRLETQEVDSYSFMRQLRLLIETEINELRGTCEHYDSNVCLICEMRVEPDLIKNSDLGLPSEVCSWCVKLLDYHETRLVQMGLTEKQKKTLPIQAFRLAVEEFEFEYWKTPVLTAKLVRQLDLRGKSPTEVKAAAALLASLPRNLNGFASERHFFAQTGLGHLIQPDNGRGKRSISRCNHLCLSMGERDICEFLFENGISHRREPLYSSLTRLKAAAADFGLMRGDFLVGKTVFEYAGMSGQADYDAKIQLKRSLCDKYHIPMTVVYPNDLAQLGRIFGGIAPSTDW